jgi:hypothetical protein
LSFAVGVAAAVASLVYALLNPVLQTEHLSAEFLQAEIANGRLALRATSVIAGISFCLLLWRVSREPPPEWTGGSDPEADYRTFLEEAERGKWPPERAAAQGVLFMVVLVGLWIFAVTSRSSTLIAVLNWTFAFIVDDFAMSANYATDRRVAPPFLDAIKIIAGSLTTIVLFLIVLFREYSTWVGWITFSFTLFVAVSALIRAYEPLVRSGISTFGILPDEDDWLSEEEIRSLEDQLRFLRSQGVLTEEELFAKLRLLPKLPRLGTQTHEITHDEVEPTEPRSTDCTADTTDGGTDTAFAG